MPGGTYTGQDTDVPTAAVGNILVTSDAVSEELAYQMTKLLFENLSFMLPPGGIVGVIGPNGAGKSTLFRMLTGGEQPDEGQIVVGETVQLSYVDQSRDALNPEATVWEEISGGAEIIALGDATIASRAYCGAFNFKGGDQQKKVGLLSGGERNRVHMAKLLKSGGNVLLLDEPTNDLDVETLGALEEAIENFAGCAVVISHDRFFLDRLATHILAFEGDSHVEWFEGNFEAYEEDKRRRLGDAARAGGGVGGAERDRVRRRGSGAGDRRRGAARAWAGDRDRLRRLLSPDAGAAAA